MSNGDPVFSSRHITIANYLDCNRKMTAYGYKAQTLVNYNKALKHFLKFYLSDSRIGLKQADWLEYDRLKGVKNEVDLASKGLEVARRKEHQETKAQAPLPPNPFEVQEVLRRAKKDFLGLMEKAKTEELGKVAVAHINRHICCHICLTQGHRPSVVQNLMLREYQQGMSRPVVKKYNDTFHVILVAEHKTANAFDAQIVINSEWKEIMDDYVRYVRQPIVEKFTDTPANFFLQADGNCFAKVSSALTAYQKSYGIPTPFSCTDARKSFETYAGRVDATLRTDISDFLAHSEKVARTHYQFADTERAVDSAVAMTGIVRCNQANPGCMPSKEQVYSSAGSTDKPVAVSPVQGQAAASGCKTPPNPEVAQPKKYFHSPPGTKFEDKKKMIVDHLMEEQSADNLRLVQIPTILELRQLFNCHDQTSAKTMQRAIRYQKELEWG